LHPQLIQAVTTLGFTNPTPIQSSVIPLLLSGQDVAGQSHSGTGMTHVLRPADAVGTNDHQADFRGRTISATKNSAEHTILYIPPQFMQQVRKQRINIKRARQS
jgi:hypothetical protein